MRAALEMCASDCPTNWRAELARDASISLMLKAGEDLEEGRLNIEANTPTLPRPGVPSVTHTKLSLL